MLHEQGGVTPECVCSVKRVAPVSFPEFLSKRTSPSLSPFTWQVSPTEHSETYLGVKLHRKPLQNCCFHSNVSRTRLCGIKRW